MTHGWTAEMRVLLVIVRPFMSLTDCCVPQQLQNYSKANTKLLFFVVTPLELLKQPVSGTTLLAVAAAVTGVAAAALVVARRK